MHCLEPSACFGGIAVAMQKLGGSVQVIELLLQVQTILTLQNLLVFVPNFFTANTTNSFQVVIQNPPFSRQISQVGKAYQSLSYGAKVASLAL